MVDSIYEESIKRKKPKHRVKALIYQSKFAITLEENAQLKIINNFKKEIQAIGFPEKNILKSLLAELYLDYYNENRWKIRNRTQTEDKTDSVDFRTWDLETLLNEAKLLFQQSLEPKNQLQNISIADYYMLLDVKEDSSNYRPTLYDLLAHNALNFYQQEAQQMDGPAQSIEILDSSYFLNPLRVEIPQTEHFDPKTAALKLYQELLALHEARKNIVATIVLQMDYLEYLKNNSAITGAYGLYEKALNQLIVEYKGNEATTLLLFDLASHHFAQQQKSPALSLCNEAIDAFPKSRGAEYCQRLKKEILSSDLTIISDEVLPINQHAKLLVEYKNIDSIEFSLYQLKKAFINFDKLLNSDSAKNHFIAKHTAIKSFSAVLKNPKDYREHSTEVLLPPLPSGNYVILARAFDASGKKIFAYNNLQVSNLAVITTELNKKERFQLINRNTGAPFPNSTVILYKHQEDEPLATLTTDMKGFATFPYPNSYTGLDVLAIHENDSLLIPQMYIRTYNSNRGEDKETVIARVKLLTDRSIYRPGQEVFFKAILMSEKNNITATVAGQYLKITLENVNDEEVAHLRVKTNDFGSATGSFKLPATGLTGQYSLIADEDHEEKSEFYDYQLDDFHYSSTTISVEEYKRPTFEVDFAPITASYSLNDSIKTSGTATAFSGAKLSNAKVSYAITRKTEFKPWYYGGYSRPYFGEEEQEITSGETKTDSDGNFEIVFKAIPDTDSDVSAQPVFIYEVTANVTDINGETRTATNEIKLAYHRLEASINLPNRINRNERDVKIEITIKNLNEQEADAKGEIKVNKLQGPDKIAIERKWQQPDLPILSDEEYKGYFPLESTQSVNDYQQWPLGEMLLSTQFNTTIDKEVPLSPLKSWPIGKYVAQLETEDSLGNKIEAKTYFEVFDPKLQQLAEPQLFSIEKDKSAYQAGDKAQLSIGSSSPEISITIDIERAHEIIESRIIHLSNEIKTIEIPAGNNELGGFAILYSYANFNRYESGRMIIPVEKEIKQLEISTSTFRDKLLPGAEETWSFKVLGEKKAEKEAELLASMYDSSLDQFKPHQWRFNPFQTPNYNSYRRSNAPGFGTSYFRSNNYGRDYYRRPTYMYDSFNWFGFSLSGNYYAKRQYLNKLRSVFFTTQTPTIAQSNSNSVKKGFISGTITDNNGAPLEGVNIYIKGTGKGIITDERGQYTIEASKGDTAIISFIGLQNVSVTIENKNVIDVKMAADIQALSEVVVVGYGVQREQQSLSSAVSVIEEDLEVFREVVPSEQAAPSFSPSNSADNAEMIDLKIRGTRAIGSDNPPLYIIDGVPVTEMDLSPEDIVSMEVFKGATAIALYGSRAANGAVIITSKKGQAKLDQMLMQVKSRTNFKETAFFYPQLTTNKKGEVSFNFTAPESLTRWKLQLLAHNKSLAVGYKSLQAVTQKDLMVSPNAPRFLRKGDVLSLSTKVTNLSAEPISGKIALVLEDAISGQSVDVIFQNTASQQNFSIAAKNTTEVSWEIKVPEQYDALQYKVVATTGNYSDGEQNIIPILPSKELVIESLPFTIRESGMQTFTFSRLKENKSTTLNHHQLTFELTTNPIWNAIKSLPYLMEYPYECSEQIFSRYFANKLGSQILADNPAIQAVFNQWKEAGNFKSPLEENPDLKNILIQETPWLRDAQSEAEQQKRIALLFDLEKMDQQLTATLDQLAQMQLPNGGFPWFSGNGKANRYITQYILAGLGQLQKIAPLDSDARITSIVSKGIEYLDAEIQEDYELLLKNKKLYDKINLSDQQIDNAQGQAIYTRSFFDEKIPASSQKAYDYYSNQSKEYWKGFGIKLRGMIALSHFRMGDKKLAYKILASLNENSIVSEEMGMYWKENVSGYYWTQSPIETQALMISLFDEIGPSDPSMKEENLKTIIEDLQIWLLQNKRSNQWSTTKATTQAIYALLQNNKEQLSEMDDVQVSLGSKTIDVPITEKGAGYIKESWGSEEIDRAMSNISITKKNDGLAYGAVYWQYLEELDKIEANTEGPLKLTKRVFKVNRNANGEILSEVTDSVQLSLGDKVRIRIVLKSDRDMEFLHMKDQRAAGLEPVDVISAYKWQDGLGYYQSTKDASTNFFFEDLSKGVFVFEYDLLVNNAGTFLNGITTIESMYAPEFKSHSEGIILHLKK